MATIEESIEAALFGHVRDLSLDEEPQIAWPNVAFPDGDATKPLTYIEVKHFPNDNARLFMRGAAPHMRQGILQLIVRTPLQVGPSVATKIAGEIAEFFPADLDLFEDGARISVQSAPDVGAAEKTDDAVSWSVMVSVRYEVFA